MASAKGALQRVASLSRSNGGLSINLMRRVVVAAITSVALYGSEIWWRGQQDRLKKLQLLLNSQARAITGLLRSTPLTFLQQESCLPYAKDLLDHRQTRYAVRALTADRDHPTHQLLPDNFRLGELYRHEGATGQPSSTSWIRPEKTHRLLGSRLAQQVVKHVNYDTEFGFDLPCKEASPEVALMTRTHGYQQMAERMLPNHPQQMTLFVRATKDASFGVGAAWKERNGRKTKAASLGKHLTEVDAALFGIGMVGKDLLSNMSRTNHQCVEIVTNSRLALMEIQSTRYWVLPIITDIKRQARRVEEEGGRVVLAWLPSSNNCEAYKATSAAAHRAAR
jgi:hypothetical protein